MEKEENGVFSLSPPTSPPSLFAPFPLSERNRPITYSLYKPMSGNGLKRGRGIAKKGKEENLAYAYSLKRPKELNSYRCADWSQHNRLLLHHNGN